jgi:hypothetical protein
MVEEYHWNQLIDSNHVARIREDGSEGSRRGPLEGVQGVGLPRHRILSKCTYPVYASCRPIPLPSLFFLILCSIVQCDMYVFDDEDQ